MGGPAKEDSFYVAGYRYFMGVHMVPCYGPVDAVKRIMYSEREAWSGNVTSSSEIVIDAPQLLGGDDREGGLVGEVNLHFGDTPLVDSYLTDILGEDIPGYRGVFSIICHAMQFSANSPYFKKFWVEVERVYRDWYPTAAEVIGHANPAHIIYETLTSHEWGMHYPASAIDDASFRDAADTFKAEGFGMALQWKSDQTIEDFIASILVTTGSLLTVDPTTGLFKLKLIRYDYDVNTIPSYDEQSIDALEDFQRPTWGESVNEVTLTFTDRSTHLPDQVTVQNLAAIEAQGGIINEHKSFGGIPTAELATRVAQRELLIKSTPLSSIRIKVNRKAWDVGLGSVFKFSWEKMGLVDVVYRAMAVDLGTFDKPYIVIEAAEDVFGMPDSSYVDPQTSEWSPPSFAPITITEQMVIELPYYMMVRRYGQDEIDALDPDAGYVGTFAKKPGGLQVNYSLYQSGTSGSGFTEVRSASFTPEGELSGEVTESVTSFVLQNNDDFTPANPGAVVFIGTEICEVISYTTTTRTLVVKRGIMDTHPVKHVLGDQIWLADARAGFDSTERTDAETVYYKSLSNTGQGTDLLVNATQQSVTLDARANRPYPPANIKIKGTHFPSQIAATGDLVITWSHRDRLQQTAGYTGWTEASIGPEAGVTYTVVIKSGVTTLRTIGSIAGDTYTYTNAFEIADAGELSAELTVEMYSTRGGLNSFQLFSHTFKRNVASGLNLSATPEASADLNLTEVII